MATSARRSISLSSLRRRAENSAALDILCSYLFFPTLLPTGNRKQILGDHAPAHMVWGRSGDGHRGPRIFLRPERAGGGGFGSRESGPAGDGAFVENPRKAAERT